MAYVPKQITGSSVGGFTATRVPFAAADGTLTDDAGMTYVAATDTLTVGGLVATTVNGLTITTSTGTLTIAAGKTATVSNTLTFTGTDGSSIAFGAGGTVAYTANNLSVFAATTSAQLAGVISDETGTGTLVYNTSPVLAGTLQVGGTMANTPASAPQLFVQAAGFANLLFHDSNQGANLKRWRIGGSGIAAGDFVLQSINDDGTLKNTVIRLGSANEVGFYGVAPVARAAAIAAPTTPGAIYSQAEAQSMETAVNAIRTALTNIGITS